MSPQASYIDYTVQTPQGTDIEYRWERSAGTTAGAVYDSGYDPDLPPGTYYLKIHWERIGWTIKISPL